MPKLPIPDEVWDQHVAILAKTGAGKSFLVQLVTEGQLAAGKRVCIVDPTDRYWGLRMMPNGKPSPYDITIVGGERGDIALRPDHGKALAEIVGKSATNMIVSTRKLSKDGRAQFAADFFEHLLAVNQGILHLTIDECHLFAPQQGLKAGGFTPRMLSATNEIASSGRGVGLCMNFVSQRAAKLHNDVLACAETLIAMKMKLPHDVDAVRNWIKEWASLEQGKEVVASLSRLKTGEAWVWASDHDMLERIKVPHVATYDSGAPGAAQKAPDLKPMDMDTITAKLAAAGEKILADDPRALKVEIAKLKREAGQQGANEADLERAYADGQKTGWDDGYLAAMSLVQPRVEEIRGQVTGLLNSIAAESPPSNSVEKINTPRPLPPVPVRNARPAPRPGAPKADLPKGELATLKAIAQYPDGATREQLSVLTGYKRSSRDAYIQRLKEKGLIDTRMDGIQATADGIDALGDDYEPLPTGRALQAYWIGRLPEGERAVLQVLIDSHPGTVPREEIDNATSYKRSSRDAYIQRLKSRQLVTIEGRGEVRASDHLFGGR